MILVKGIKPARLREQALRLELLNAMRSAGEKIVKEDFKATTKTWEHQPEFEVLMSLKAPGPTILIGTDDQVWNWLDEGTEPHPIFAGVYTGRSRKKVLSFPSIFRSKTRPGWVGSRAGSSGGSTVFTPYVEHPGTEPRNWSGIIARKRRRFFKEQMQKAMVKAAAASGHGM